MNRRGFFRSLFHGAALAAATVYAPSVLVKAVVEEDFVLGRGLLNTFDVGAANREDLLDIMTNISPIDTLYLSGFKKMPASLSKKHDWLVDILAKDYK